MHHCPCCDRRLLRHIGRNGIYWFCLHCRLEMPILANSHDSNQTPQSQQVVLDISTWSSKLDELDGKSIA